MARRKAFHDSAIAEYKHQHECKCIEQQRRCGSTAMQIKKLQNTWTLFLPIMCTRLFKCIESPTTYASHSQSDIGVLSTVLEIVHLRLVLEAPLFIDAWQHYSNTNRKRQPIEQSKCNTATNHTIGNTATIISSTAGKSIQIHSLSAKTHRHEVLKLVISSRKSQYAFNQFYFWYLRTYNLLILHLILLCLKKKNQNQNKNASLTICAVVSITFSWPKACKSDQSNTISFICYHTETWIWRIAYKYHPSDNKSSNCWWKADTNLTVGLRYKQSGMNEEIEGQKIKPTSKLSAHD